MSSRSPRCFSTRPFRTWFRERVLNRPRKQQPQPELPRSGPEPVTASPLECSPGEPDPAMLEKVELPTSSHTRAVELPSTTYDISQPPLPAGQLLDDPKSSSRAGKQPIRPVNHGLDIYENDDADNDSINAACSDSQHTDSGAVDTGNIEELDSDPSRSPQCGTMTKTPVKCVGGFVEDAPWSGRITKSGAPIASRSSSHSIASDFSGVWYESAKVGEETKQVSPDAHKTLEAKRPPIASRLDCDIKVLVGEVPLKRCGPIQILWLEAGQYDRVKHEIKRLLNKHVKDEYLQKPIIYRTSAEVNLWKRITGTESLYERLASTVVEHRDHWNGRVPALVAEHSARNIFEELKLEVVWHFDAVVIGGKDGRSLADKIWYAVDSKLMTNWNNQQFLPMTSLHGIFKRETIRELIKHDTSLSEPSPNLEDGDISNLRKWLVDEVWLKAVRMIAICIFAQKPLSCLHHLMTKVEPFGLRDENLPLSLEKIDMPKLDLLPLMEVQKNFLVYNFDAARLRKNMVDEGKYEVIPPDSVVPITRVGHLGDGTFGSVDEVIIHPDHHTFEEKTFALKRIFATPVVSRAFDKELKVIVNLMNMFHNNILLPLAMWRQENTEGDDMFYILYPKAQYDLKDYMRPHRRTPSLTRDFVEHLMLQIWNRADALESMHLLSRRLGLVEDSTQSTVHPEPAETPLQYAAYYHDLKHDNILVFEDGTWKISDFGTAGVTQAISGGKSIFEVTDVQLGDPVYSPPDLAQGKYTAKGYDIWCFGCILLEILLTIFQNNTPEHLDEWNPDNQADHRLDQFYVERANSVHNADATALFWFKKPGMGCVLRQPVIDGFEMLRRRTREQDQFDVLTELAINMMNIDPADRPSAKEVAHRMKALRTQVLHNLKLNETFYLIPGSIAQPWASRKATEEGHHASSLPATADLLSNGVPWTLTRH